MEEEMGMKIEVREKCREMIKPSSPTPSHLQTFFLSLLDQGYPPYHLPLILFYSPPAASQNVQQTPIILDVSALKLSLADTLSRFYPLAGRCADESTVSCNDKGVPFIETHVNCLLSDLLGSPNKLDFLTKFLPPKNLLLDRPPTTTTDGTATTISDYIPLVFQVNVFDCGGFVIGLHAFHKILDAASLATFLLYWAALTSGRHDKLFLPDFDASVRVFPPCKIAERLLVPANFQGPPPSLDDSSTPRPPPPPPPPAAPVIVVPRSFIFTKAAITKLKTILASELTRNPSSFEAVAAFVWEQVLSAAGAGDSAPAAETVLQFPADMRRKTSTPLPKEAMGNVAVTVEARTNNRAGLAELAQEIREAMSTVKQRVSEFEGEGGTEAYLAYREKMLPRIMVDKPGLYMISSCCKLGWGDVDFGSGKPSWIVPVPIVNDGGKTVSVYKNVVVFSDHTDSGGDGIEAWVNLEEEEMQRLVCNQRFLEFAYPNS